MKTSGTESELDDRAVRALASPKHWLLASLLLLPASYAALTIAWRAVVHYWSAVLALASRWVIVPMTLAAPHDERAWLARPLLELHWAGRAPGTVLVLVTALVCIGVFSASFMRKERWLPLAYLVRVIAAVQFVVCAFFFGLPDSFPYAAQAHMREIFTTEVIGIKITPITMSLMYYPLDFTLMQKAFATALITSYFIAITPFFLTFHACVVFYGSLLFVPIAFFVLGAPLLLGLLLALYSYCASWPCAQRRIRGP